MSRKPAAIELDDITVAVSDMFLLVRFRCVGSFSLNLKETKKLQKFLQRAERNLIARIKA